MHEFAWKNVWGHPEQRQKLAVIVCPKDALSYDQSDRKNVTVWRCVLLNNTVSFMSFSSRWSIHSNFEFSCPFTLYPLLLFWGGQIHQFRHLSIYHPFSATKNHELQVGNTTTKWILVFFLLTRKAEMVRQSVRNVGRIRGWVLHRGIDFRP